MYHTTVSNSRGIFADTLSEGLAEAILFCHEVGKKGDRVVVYEAVKDASGEVLHIAEVLSTVLE